MNVLDGGDDVVRLCVLEKVAGSSCSEHRRDRVDRSEGGYREDSRAAHPSRDSLRRVDAIDPWHLHINERDVRSQPVRKPDGLSTVSCFTDDLEPVGLEEDSERATDEGVVVGDEHGDLVHANQGR